MRAPWPNQLHCHTVVLTGPCEQAESLFREDSSCRHRMEDLQPPVKLAVAEEFIVRKIKVFSSHYCSPFGIPPGEINFHLFSPYSGWQKLITGFIMPFSSPTLRLFWPPMSPSFRLLHPPPPPPQVSNPALAPSSTGVKNSQEFRFWSSQTVAWAFTKEWHCRWPA